MKSILAILAAAAVAGCGTTTAFDNVAACTAGDRQLIVASMYGPIGIASKVRKIDSSVLCATAAASSGSAK